MKKIFILGYTGMLGRYVSTYFKSKNYMVIDVSRDDFDAKFINETMLTDVLINKGLDNGDVVINCIGLIKQKTNVSDLDFILVNTAFPRTLANVCEKNHVKLIHPTTDCVYDGLHGYYTEEHRHDAKDMYGKSKSWGEPDNCTVIRTSIIGEELTGKLSLIEWVKSNKNNTVNGYTNHLWNGITCLQFAKVCEEIIMKYNFWDGVRHILSPRTVSKHELVEMISNIYELNITVNPVETEIKCNRAMISIYPPVCLIPDLEVQIKEQKNFQIS